MAIIDFSQRSLLLSLAAIAFNPTAWNIVAQNGACYLRSFMMRARTNMLAVCRVPQQDADTRLRLAARRLLLPRVLHLLLRTLP
jgi:hypothetical protein